MATRAGMEECRPRRYTERANNEESYVKQAQTAIVCDDDDVLLSRGDFVPLRPKKSRVLA